MLKLLVFKIKVILVKGHFLKAKSQVSILRTNDPLVSINQKVLNDVMNYNQNKSLTKVSQKKIQFHF